jgi:putative DNA primase/helicase
MEICVDQSNNMVWSAARSYAKYGIYVNPVNVTRKSDGKKDVRPVGLWRDTSSTSLADIGAWEQAHPNAGLLIDCGKSGLVVVDCDGQEGIANWQALFGEDGPPDALGMVNTAGGGQHWYYRAHPDHPIGNDQSGKVAPCVDIRGLGGFVFAPPTTDGQGAWAWHYGPSWDRPDATVPVVVVERMTAHRSSAPAQPTAPAEVSDDLFDDAQRRFTRDQAVAYVKGEMAKLGATKKGFNGAINNFAMTCAHFPWLVDRERCGQLMIKALGKAQGWSEPDRDDRLTINSAYAATESGKSWVAVEVAAPPKVAVSTAEGDDTPHLSPPGQPMKVAREILAARERPLRWWQGAYYEHLGRHWAETSDDMIKKWIYSVTEDATFSAADGKGGIEVKKWSPTAGKVTNIHEALSRGVVQHEHEPVIAMAMENGVLDPATRTLSEHDPERFNLSSLPFSYDPEAECPQWLDFLESTLPGDRQAHETIAEWMGYVLSGRTDLHKIGVLVGPPRCGKGTISRVLKAMVGRDGWAAPTLARLGSEFGMASLIGRGLAVMGDVRWTSKHVIDAVPIMLGISGEDGFSIPRKHVGDWIGKLPTRLMLMSNDAPVFTDASGALAGRMVYVAFHRSFLGSEDLTLEGRLMGELPGILNWALDGLDRVVKLGTFTQSAGSMELAAEVDRDSSPVKAWVDDRCVIDLTAEMSLESLLSSYRDWLTAENMSLSPSLNRLSRDLRSAFGDQGVTVERKSNGVGGKHRVVTGIRVIAGASIPSDLFDL